MVKLYRTAKKKVRDLNTGKVYDTIREASQAVGISPTQISYLIAGKRHDDYHKFEFVNCFDPSTTLCCGCSKYDCSWVKRLVPVEGWEATENKVLRSYNVNKCPEYEPMRREKSNGNRSTEKSEEEVPQEGKAPVD